MNQNKWPTISEIGAVTIVFGVLCVAMVPALIHVRQQEQDERMTCLTNVKLLNLGIIQYVQDYDEVFPASYKGAPQTWAGRIVPYVKSVDIYKCPSDSTTADESIDPIAAPLSYALNSNLNSGRTQSDSRSLAEVDAPAQTVDFFEIAGAKIQIIADEGTQGYWHRPSSMMLSPSGDGLGMGPEWGWRGAVGQSPLTYAFTRHDGGANYGLSDGHAHWFTPDQVSFGRNPSYQSLVAAPDPDKGIAAGAGIKDFRATFSVY